ncbi:MAG: glycosyltransferase family 92 protein [Kiritimatiellaeota bacterium]|nr:glycosyltransferase family 92 protein [Kiritimatiellota bacterium]
MRRSVNPWIKIPYTLLSAVLCPFPPRLNKVVRNLWIRGGFWRTLKVAYAYLRHRPATFPHCVCAAAIVKNEASYIAEWIDYHRLIGVERFFIYDNESTDALRDVLAPYVAEGVVTLTPFPGKFMQVAAYEHAAFTHKYETRWMLYLDIDEFLVLKRHATLPEFLRGYEDVNQVSLHWLMFGSSGHDTRTPGLVIERFTRRQLAPACDVKSIVNPRALVFGHCHAAGILGRGVDEHRRRFYYGPNRNPALITADIAAVHHYYCKSAEEYLAKAKRGGSSSIPGQPNPSFIGHRRYNDIDDTALLPFASRLRKAN